MPKIKTGGKYRTEVYSVIQNILGRELSKEEHGAIKIILQNMANARTDDLQKRLQRAHVAIQKTGANLSEVL